MSAVLQQSRSGIAELLPALARWEFDVQRAIDELHIKVSGPGAEPVKGLALAHRIWSLYRRQPVFRVVLELSELTILSPQINLELVLLNRWIGKCGGVMRLCGLSPEQLQSSRLYRWFDYYPDYQAALRDDWPTRRRMAVNDAHPWPAG
jgi:hypothetical protein